MKTPSFWYSSEGAAPDIRARLLKPLSAIYQMGHRWSMASQVPRKAPMPVFCVGGAVAGGSGKTPVCQSLMRMLSDIGSVKSPAFLTRGYGGSNTLSYMPDFQGFKSAQVGDEALLLASVAPTIVAKIRAQGIDLALENEIDFLVMDDGLQNNTLHKDLSFLVVDGPAGFGNGMTIPSGPLREPVEDVVDRVDAVIVIGEDRCDVQAYVPEDVPVFQAHAVLDKHAVEGVRDVVAFAGIGRPQKFFDSLSDAGVTCAYTYEFPDHYDFTQHDVRMLHDKAKELCLPLLTTEKDYVRLKSAEMEAGVSFVPMSLQWSDEDGLKAFLQQEIQRIQSVRAEQA